MAKGIHTEGTFEAAIAPALLEQGGLPMYGKPLRNANILDTKAIAEKSVTP